MIYFRNIEIIRYFKHPDTLRNIFYHICLIYTMYMVTLQLTETYIKLTKFPK